MKEPILDFYWEGGGLGIVFIMKCVVLRNFPFRLIPCCDLRFDFLHIKVAHYILYFVRDSKSNAV